jgi:hypothetical protein
MWKVISKQFSLYLIMDFIIKKLQVLQHPDVKAFLLHVEGIAM